jgi:hypothetical protein
VATLPWNARQLCYGISGKFCVESVATFVWNGWQLSRGIRICHLKKVMHRGWAYFQARLAFTMAAFNVLVQWHGFQPHASGFVPLSIAEFSL